MVIILLLQWNNNGNVAIGNTAPSTAFNVWDGINVTEQMQ